MDEKIRDIHVVGAVIKENEKILCAKRGNTKTLPNMWEFPGGKIEKGETPEIALIREIQEEMQCLVEVHEKIAHTIYEYDFATVHLTTFNCSIASGIPILKEHSEIKWLSIQELNNLDWAPADIPTVYKLTEKR